jgi:hypothetical protein
MAPPAPLAGLHSRKNADCPRTGIRSHTDSGGRDQPSAVRTQPEHRPTDLIVACGAFASLRSAVIRVHRPHRQHDHRRSTACPCRRTAHHRLRHTLFCHLRHDRDMQPCGAAPTRFGMLLGSPPFQIFGRSKRMPCHKQ